MPRATPQDLATGNRRLRLRFATLLACAGVLLGATPAPADALTVQTASITPVEGTPFSGVVGTITDVATPGCQPVVGYQVTVTWADSNTTSSETVAGPGTASGLDCTYPVSTGHTFDEEGSQAFYVRADSPLGSSGPTLGSAEVTDAPLTAVAVAVAGGPSTPLQATVATLTDANAKAGTADYTATIDWGDGTPASPAQVTTTSAGAFNVSGGHSYAKTGTYATTVTVRDDGLSAATATGAATITGSPSAPRPASKPTPTGSGPSPVNISPPELAGATTLSMRISCPAEGPHCRGVARVLTLPATAAKSGLRAGTSLGSVLFVLDAGEARTVTITVAARLRRVLHHLHSARLAGVTITFGEKGRSLPRTGPSAVIITTGLR